MVKNEETVIKQTLLPFVQEDPLGITIGYVVYDTGDAPWSTTMEKSKELFEEYGITNYCIVQDPFIDFSTSRNRALRFAETKFPGSTFLLMLDAEWYIKNLNDLLLFCQQKINDTATNVYLLQLVTPFMVFHTARLIRAQTNVCFEGVVHECISKKNSVDYGPATVSFDYPEKPQGLQASRKRWLRDRDLLLNEYKKNPIDTRNIFYLAQTYDCLQDYENAYFYYSKRALLKDFEEEDYMAQYRLGMVSEKIVNKEGAINWPQALTHYLNAFFMRPSRAEPLVRIAAYYINHELYDLAFLYAYIACQIPYPTDILFVEKPLYDTIRYEIFAKAALHTQIEIPLSVCKQACAINAHIVPQEGKFLAQSLGIQF